MRFRIHCCLYSTVHCICTCYLTCIVPHCAVQVVTQQGMQNNPGVYADFFVEALAAANRQIQANPHMLCEAVSGQHECSGCVCHVQNDGVDVSAYVNHARGTSPEGAVGDFLSLAGGPASVKLEILPAGAGYVGALKLTTMLAMGFEIPLVGSGARGGFVGICDLFDWVSCVSHDCCYEICEPGSAPIEVKAVTQLEVTVMFHHNQTTGSLSASMDNCPGGECLKIPNIEDDLIIECGCMAEILKEEQGSWMLEAIAWISAEGTVGHMAKTMLATAESQILPTLTSYLSDQGAMVAPQHCGIECGLPEGVTISYRIPIAPDFVAAEYVELQVDMTICLQDIQDIDCAPPAIISSAGCCFPPRDPVAPPSNGRANTTRNERPYDIPEGGAMLGGFRMSSSVMNGVSWALGAAGELQMVEHTTFLDAPLSLNVSWADQSHPPVLNVPSDGKMGFEWSNGFVVVQCNCEKCDRQAGQTDMLDFSWRKLLGTGTFNHSLGGCNSYAPQSSECTGIDAQVGRGRCEDYISQDQCSLASPPGRCFWTLSRCKRNTCVFSQVDSFDTSNSDLQLTAPSLPVPSTLLVDAMTSALQSGKAALNQVLDDNAMCLPPGVSAYLIPPPVATIFAQHSKGSQYGFVELVSFCGSLPGQTPCITQHEPAATSGGRADCLSSSSAASVPASAASLALLSAVQAPDKGRSTYISDGVEYSMGNYMLVQGDQCASAVECASSPKSCTSTRFENAKCSSYNRWTCTAGTLVHTTFEGVNCTGNVTKNETKSIVDRCNTSAHVWCWDPPNCSKKTSINFSEIVICPHAIQPPPHGISDNSMTTHVLTIVVCTLACGVCTAGLACLRSRCSVHSDTHTWIWNLLGRIRDCGYDWIHWVVDQCSCACRFCSRYLAPVSSCASAVWRAITAWVLHKATRWRHSIARACTAVCELTVNPQTRLGIHDWVQMILLILSALGYAVHGWFWYTDDPFAAFNQNFVGEVGLNGNWIDAAPVQREFAAWSWWGRFVQLMSFIIIIVAMAVGLIDQVTSKLRNTLFTGALGIVTISQFAVILAPSFVFEFRVELFYNVNHSFTSDPDTKGMADSALSLAFDGVALTFVSSLFVFMLHGLAPGVFLGSCFFCSHLTSLQQFQASGESTITQTTPAAKADRGLKQPLRSSMNDIDSNAKWRFSVVASEAAIGSARHTFVLGSRSITNSWLAPPGHASAQISDRVLGQQQSRVKILNWLATIGSPCGACLPVIIIYQSLGAQIWWAILWPMCWVVPSVLMWPLSTALESRGRSGWANSLTNGATAIFYAGTYLSITAAILIGLLAKAREGGFVNFTITFPASAFFSTALGTMSLTLSYLELSMLGDATREHIGEHLGSELSSVMLEDAQATANDDEVQSAVFSGDHDAKSLPTVRACIQYVWRWLIEYEEQRDPRRYGRRLPMPFPRRALLIFGLGLCSVVLVATFDDNNGFQDLYVLQDVKNWLDDPAGGGELGLKWPAGNATVLDDAFDTFGRCCKAAFLLQCCAVSFLLCSCWCDLAMRDLYGLQASRIYGFLGLGTMFVSSLVPAGPNYLHISQMDQLMPCCAPRFNFAVTTLLQDLVGIACSGIFAARLLPVLLIVVPSMVRACTLLLIDDIERRSKDVKKRSLQKILANYSDPAFSRSNVHSVLALSSMLTPIFTAIPMTVVFQFLRRSDKTALLPAMMLLFFVGPIALGVVQCDTTKRVEVRYFLWLFSYFGPLCIMTVYEAFQYDAIMSGLKAQLASPLTYVEIAAEVFIANVILSDLMYANLYVEGKTDLEHRAHCPSYAYESEVADRRLHTLLESTAVPQRASIEGHLQQPEAGPEPEPERFVSSVGLSRQASPMASGEERSSTGYIQVIEKSGLDFSTRKLLHDGGLGSLNLLRAASRDDVVGCGLDAAQAATLFVALANLDAGLDEDQSLSTSPNIDNVDVAEGHPSHKLKQKVLLLGLGPLVVFACTIAFSLQALRYIDVSPLAFINDLRSDSLHPALGPPRGQWSQADNGHPCPWEPQP